MQITDIRKVGSPEGQVRAMRVTFELAEKEVIYMAALLAACTSLDEVNRLVPTLLAEAEPID